MITTCFSNCWKYSALREDLKDELITYKKLNLWVEVRVTRVNVTGSLVINATGLWFGNLQNRDKLVLFWLCSCFQFAACRMNSVGVSDSSIIYDQRFSASSSLSSSHASKGRLNGGSAWIPSSNNDNSDYLQIDLGSVFVVCAVATQGNPSANDWTETYKIETSLDNVNWQWYQENNTVKVW